MDTIEGVSSEIVAYAILVPSEVLYERGHGSYAPFDSRPCSPILADSIRAELVS